MLAKGLLGPKDDKRAAELYAKGCDIDPHEGCDDAGHRYLSGWGVTKDEKRGAELLVRGCMDGDEGNACGLIADALWEKAERATQARAIELRRKAMLFAQHGCDLNSGRACLVLGRLMEASAADGGTANGTSTVLAKAARYLDEECDKGEDPFSCVDLALLIEAGRVSGGTAQRAAALRKRACDLDPRKCPGK